MPDLCGVSPRDVPAAHCQLPAGHDDDSMQRHYASLPSIGSFWYTETEPSPTPDKLAQRLAEIRAREQAATPGPWEAGAYSTIHSAVCRVTGRIDRTPEGYNNCPLLQDPATRTAHDPDCGPVVAYAETAYGDTPGPQHRRDQEFIAHARADIPFLLALLDRLTRHDGWLVYQEDDGTWGAEHTTKRGLVAAAERWRDLYDQMCDAETTWDDGMAERRA